MLSADFEEPVEQVKLRLMESDKEMNRGGYATTWMEQKQASMHIPTGTDNTRW